MKISRMKYSHETIAVGHVDLAMVIVVNATNNRPTNVLDIIGRVSKRVGRYFRLNRNFKVKHSIEYVFEIFPCDNYQSEGNS